MNKPNLPIFQSNSPLLQQLQTVWKAAITPAIQSELIQGRVVEGISLIAGNTTFNHLLSRPMTGWFIIDQNAAATIYRSAPLNDKTLTLNSDAPCVVALWVF